MKKYKIIKPIVLGFLTAQDQYDTTIYPNDDTYLEFDGSTIFLCSPEKRRASITMGYAMVVFWENGQITDF